MKILRPHIDSGPGSVGPRIFNAYITNDEEGQKAMHHNRRTPWIHCELVYCLYGLEIRSKYCKTINWFSLIGEQNMIEMLGNAGRTFQKNKNTANYKDWRCLGIRIKEVSFCWMKILNVLKQFQSYVICIFNRLVVCADEREDERNWNDKENRCFECAIGRR